MGRLLLGCLEENLPGARPEQPGPVENVPAQGTELAGLEGPSQGRAVCGEPGLMEFSFARYELSLKHLIFHTAQQPRTGTLLPRLQKPLLFHQSATCQEKQFSVVLFTQCTLIATENRLLQLVLFLPSINLFLKAELPLSHLSCTSQLLF